MLYLVTVILATLATALPGQAPLKDTPCLTPDQDKQLHTSIMAIDATLKLTVTSLDIAAMWKTGLVQEQLKNASRIISAVDTSLVQNMVKITEQTCGTCSQIVKGVHEIVHDLENTLTQSVPEWKTNPIFNSVVAAVNAIVNVVPAFCPAEAVVLAANVQCLTPQQQSQLTTSVTAIETTLTLTTTSLTIAAAFQQEPMKSQLTQASTIISAVNNNLVSQLTSITESTCGTCQQITAATQKIVNSLTNTISASVPDWKSNPIFSSITTAINGILTIVPGFCPSPAEFRVHQC